MIEHRPPFVVDYRHRGRTFSVTLEAPADWEDALDHLRALRVTGAVVGSGAIEIKSNVVTLWIDGLGAWLKCRWLNRRARR